MTSTADTLSYDIRRAGRRGVARRAALTACLAPQALECNVLGALPDHEWRDLLRWLHVSGLSLYLFDKLTNEDRTDLMPSFVLAALYENLTENMSRTRSMVEDLAEISAAFERSSLSAAVLKGISLCPLSVPAPWLRSQADLDFLVSAADAPRAKQILERRGFHLHAISGRSWEFRTGPIHTATFESMYRAVPFRCVELHLEPACAPQDSLFARTEQFTYEEFTFRRLAPVPLMLGQALHVYKHVCSEFFRASHVLELHNHIVARAPDRAFWQGLEAQANRDSLAALKFGVASLLTMELCGVAAAERLAWSVDPLPSAVRLWIERYGERAAFLNPPGTKLYLLLQAAMHDAGVPPRRSSVSVLLPRNLPRITTAPPNEHWLDRLRRYRLDVRFMRARFRFHMVEGLRYLRESIAWSRLLARASADSPALELHQNKQVTIR